MQRICNKFNINNLGKYHNLYNIIYVMLFFAVFQNLEINKL